MQSQKGLIQIPLLIIIIASIVVALVGTGIVLHKQGKLTPLIANISQVFKGTEKPITIEPEEIKSKTKQVSESSEEVIIPEASKSSDEEIQQKIAESEETQQLAEEIETQEELQLETESEAGPEFEPQTKPQLQEGLQKEIKVDPCANVICPVCQYCLDGNCVARPNGDNDCGSGCQRCINGSCQDYDAACPECQYCNSDTCIDYCQGIDTSCGCTSCTNCNALDGCSGDSYLDYYCSGISCAYTSDDCSDCSCSCGGYNIEESIANGNCNDSKDNDCDGTTDLEDPGCLPSGTKVSGIISEDTIWKVENSPYIAPNGILIESNSILTIEPGVTIKLGEKKNVVVRGALEAAGTKTNPIVFTAIHANSHWNRMLFEGFCQRFEQKEKSIPKSVLTHTYLYKTLGIYSDCYFPSVRHSKIEGWLPSAPHSITGSLVIMNSSKEPVLFGNNEIVLNNRYRGNIQTAISIGYPNESVEIVNNTIFLNDSLSKATGVDIANDGRGEIIIKKNIIKGNGISISLRGDWPNVKINENNLFASGSFGGGKDYTLYTYTRDDRNIDATRNWWGTTDYSVIANRIWDRDDDISLSKVNYQPIATSEIPDAGVQQ